MRNIFTVRTNKSFGDLSVTKEGVYILSTIPQNIAKSQIHKTLGKEGIPSIGSTSTMDEPLLHKVSVDILMMIVGRLDLKTALAVLTCSGQLWRLTKERNLMGRLIVKPRMNGALLEAQEFIRGNAVLMAAVEGQYAEVLSLKDMKKTKDQSFPTTAHFVKAEGADVTSFMVDKGKGKPLYVISTTRWPGALLGDAERGLASQSVLLQVLAKLGSTQLAPDQALFIPELTIWRSGPTKTIHQIPVLLVRGLVSSVYSLGPSKAYRAQNQVVQEFHAKLHLIYICLRAQGFDGIVLQADGGCRDPDICRSFGMAMRDFLTAECSNKLTHVTFVIPKKTEDGYDPSAGSNIMQQTFLDPKVGGGGGGKKCLVQ